MSKAIIDQIKSLATVEDEALSLTEVALLYAQLDNPDIHPDRYVSHLTKIKQAFAKASKKIPSDLSAQDVLKERIRIIRDVFFEKEDYKGDEQDAQNPTNITLFRIIDRRCGIPIGLALILIDVLRQVGWQAEGLNFPGHMLVRLDYQGQREIIDPFYQGKRMPSHRLRDLIKDLVGPSAELHYDYFTSMRNRDMLIRFRNSLKTRLIAEEEYNQAYDVVQSMLWLAPEEKRLYFDAGVLAAKLEDLKKAEQHLQSYITRLSDARAIAEAKSFLYAIQDKLY